MEESPAIYEMVCIMQDEIIPSLIEEYPDLFLKDKNGDVTLEYEDATELEKDFQAAAVAYRRSFDSEEHICEICSRSLLGEKFTFLTSCEHFFCTECLKDMVITMINEGKVGHITCADQDCLKGLNDLDIKNVGLDR